MTIGQLVYDNERHYLTDDQIDAKVLCRSPPFFTTHTSSAHANMASHGRVHQIWCYFDAARAPWPTRIEETSTYAIPTANERVRPDPCYTATLNSFV